MWWLLPIGIVIGIILCLFICNKMAQQLQKKMDNEIMIYENVQLILWIEWGNKMEITWDISQWESNGIMICHIIYCDKEVRAMGFANAWSVKELIEAQGPSIILLKDVTVHQWGGNFTWDF